MTTMAALLGGLPLALGGGTGSELRRPLGIAIVGGLLFSQMLTLYTTPVVYLYLDRFRLRWARAAPQGAWRKPHAGTRALGGAPSVQRRRLGRAVRRRPPAATPACAVGPRLQAPGRAGSRGLFKESADGDPGPGEWKAAAPQDDAHRGEDGGRSSATRTLNALEEQVIVSNQNIAQAEAQFRASRRRRAASSLGALSDR